MDRRYSEDTEDDLKSSGKDAVIKNMSEIKREELNKLAEDVLDISRNRLLVNLRYMDTALTFHERSVYEGRLSVDGRSLYFDPMYVLRTYRDSREELTRMYLHSVLHCIFAHPFTGADIDRRLWDLACDIASETSS